MSWPMQTAPTGQWNAGMTNMAMPPANMNMGSYTPEQWAIMQQQNWQQWAQWQQQYAQWQAQYGDEYANQVQAMQAMGGMPPLPATTAPPPAPPPPDKPPPPPHENNQPLYANNSCPAPVPAPAPAPVAQQPQTQQSINPGYNNAYNTGNIQTWSQAAAPPPAPAENIQSGANAEALKKLAEEERLFDIQFKKWEEEIEKWKKDNVNHPDKQAYNEYEQKFEACRVQLLERRQQMNLKRARLMGTNTQQTVNTAAQGNNNMVSANKPQPSFTTNNAIISSTTQQQQQLPNTTQNYTNNISYPNQNPIQYQQYAPPYQNNIQNTGIQAPYQNNKQNIVAQAPYQNSNQNSDVQNRFESYQTVKAYSESSSEKTTFLPTSNTAKGIPGLDLVPDTEKPVSNDDVIVITDDKQHQKKGPDYTKISKGIDNILGDEKIMNMLSLVRNVQNTAVVQNTNIPSVSMPTNTNNYIMPPQMQNINNYTIPPLMNQWAGMNMSSGPMLANTNNYTMPPPNNQWAGTENSYNNQYTNNRQNMPCNNRQGPYSMQQKPPQQDIMYDEYADIQQDIQQEQYYDNNNQYGGPNMANRSRLNNMPPTRAPLQDRSLQQNVNNFTRGTIATRGMPENNGPISQPARPKWIDEPLFAPSIIVEYEHKPLRLKARDFIEPVHMFDYNHISKEEEPKKIDFEKEVEELFTRKPRRFDGERISIERGERYSRDLPSSRDLPPRDLLSRDLQPRDLLPRDLPSRDLPTRDYERRERIPRDEPIDWREQPRDDYHSRPPVRDEYDDRRRSDLRHDDRRRDERSFTRREDNYKERDTGRDKYTRRDDATMRSKSREKESRKRGRSKESAASDNSKKSKENENKPLPVPSIPKPVVMIDDILESPGREMRPDKIVIIMRGPPGSGKSYLAKLIRDREAEYGGTARIMSIDDYFMQESEVEEKDPVTGKIVKKPLLKYEYDEKSEEIYTNSLKRAFKRSLTDGYFSFLIYDAVNDQLKSYADIWNFSRQNGFQVYVCTMELDPVVCHKRNIHGRSLEDIQVICSRFFQTPAHHIQLDPTTLLQNAAIEDVHMEDVVEDAIIPDEFQETEVENSFTSKWEKMDDAAQLARLDGTSKPLRPSQLTMADYLQLDDWTPNAAKPGKKTVRWADIEERRQQEKMRAIGFVVGQTDWNRMTDPTMGSSALTQTKYIERVRRN